MCESLLQACKSRRRRVITLGAGLFEAREVLKECTRDPSHPVEHSKELSMLVKPRQRHSYDLMVHVGLARYLEGKQREEIRADLLRERCIELSDGTVSNLCDRFLTYLEALHLARASQLAASIHEQGGYPLHLDATNDRGKGGLFVCMDGFREWVLVSGRIPSEHEDHMRPIVERTVELFGDPLATVRDLGGAVARAVESLRKRGIPDLVCHYHFLGAVGKSLFDEPYMVLRNTLRCSSVRSNARALLRELRCYRESSTYDGRFGSGQGRENLLVLVHWLLEGDGRKKPPYPFSLPHLDFFHRSGQLTQKLQDWVPLPWSSVERRAIGHLESLVARPWRDERLANAVSRLDKGWEAFCRLRDVLRLTEAELPMGDSCCRQRVIPPIEKERLNEIKKATLKYLDELRERVGDNTKSPDPEAVILKYFNLYGDHLFDHPALRDENGSIMAVVERTNNILEHFFGQQKQSLRRRVGRSNLGRDMEDQPAQVALTANLRHTDYVRILCGSLDNLPDAFADLDATMLERTTPLHRDNRDSALSRLVRALLDRDDYPGSLPNNEAESARISAPSTVV